MRTRIINGMSILVVSILIGTFAYAQGGIETGAVDQIENSYSSMLGIDGELTPQIEGTDLILDEEDEKSLFGSLLKGLKLKGPRTRREVFRILAEMAEENGETSVTIQDEENNRAFTVSFDSDPDIDLGLPVTITITRYRYDDDDNLILEVSDIKEYDREGNLLHTGKHIITYTYIEDRLISMHEIKTRDNVPQREVSADFLYDEEGNLVSETRVETTYDKEGNPRSHILRQTIREYDEDGNKIYEKTIYESTYTWDGKNEYYYENVVEREFEYDEDGNLISQETAGSYKCYRNGELRYQSEFTEILRRAYDSEGRLVKETYFHNSSYNNRWYRREHTRTYTYDEEGRLIKETYSYNSTSSYNWGYGREYTKTYTYDEEGRLIKEEEHGSYWSTCNDPFWVRIIKNVYNAINKLARRTETYNLWRDEAHTELMHSYKCETTYMYDHDGNLKHKRMTSKYTYYRNGKPTWTNETYLSQSYRNGKLVHESRAYLYNGSLSYQSSTTYVYDPKTGLLRRKRQITNHYSNDELYRTYIYKEDYEYDEDNTLRRKTVKSKQEGWIYKWEDPDGDDKGEWTKTWGEISSFKGEYTYDEEGRIIEEREERINNRPYWRWYCGDGVLKEADAAESKAGCIWPPYPYYRVHKEISLTTYEYDDDETFKTVDKKYYDRDDNLIGSFIGEYEYNEDGELMYLYEKGTGNQGGWWYPHPIEVIRFVDDEAVSKEEIIKYRPDYIEGLPQFSKWGDYELEIRCERDDDGELVCVTAEYKRFDDRRYLLEDLDGGDKDEPRITSYFYAVLYYKDGKLVDRKMEEYGSKQWWWYYWPRLIICEDEVKDIRVDEYSDNEVVQRNALGAQLAEDANDSRFCNTMADADEREEILPLR